MEKQDVFNKLADHLGQAELFTPPKTQELFEMLDILFTEEQAEHALQIPLTRMGEISVDDLAKKMEKPLERVREVIDEMARAGTIQAIRRGEDKTPYFSVFPLVYGILETTFGTEKEDIDKINRLSPLWQKYYPKQYEQMALLNHPLLRIVPINDQLDSESKVLPFEEVSNLVKSARDITVINCHCRSVEKKCNHIMEACVVLNDWAEYLIEYRGARKFTFEEAIQRLKECEEDGLVHLTANSQEGGVVICNCCPCCCGVLEKNNEFQGTPILSRTNLEPLLDQDACALCLSCVEICPSNAIAESPAKDESESHILVQESLCIGCGLCSIHCPEDAIQMKKVRDDLPAKTGLELVEKLQTKAVS